MGLLRKRYSPERLGNLLLRRVEKLSEATYHMPQQLQEVLDDLRLGRLSLRIEDTLGQRSREYLGRRIFDAVLIGSSILGGAWLYAADSDQAGLALFGAAATWLLARTAVDGYRNFRRKR